MNPEELTVLGDNSSSHPSLHVWASERRSAQESFQP